jgi:DNA modification methylase
VADSGKPTLFSLDELGQRRELPAEEPVARVLCGDMRELLAAMPPESVHAVVTDPPYGLEFMGKQWDQQVPGPDYWRQVLRVCKPGAHLLAFGGTRTAHRLACAIEDAGWEVRDCLSWLYGSGFPKSHDVSKAIDREAGAVREVVGSKVGLPGYHLHGHEGGEAFGHGLGSSTYETRLAASQVTAPATEAARAWDGWGTATKPAHEPVYLAVKPVTWAHVDSRLRALQEGLWSRLDAKLAALLSRSNPRDCDEDAFASVPWSAVDACNTPDVSCVPTDTSPSELALVSSWSTVSSWRRILAARSHLESTSTTSTATRPTTDWKTLLSCLSRITPESMLKSHGRESSAHASPAVVLLSALVAGCHATLVRSVVEPAFAGEVPDSLGAAVLQHFAPNWEPVYLCRKPFKGSVASNVLEHACGALNVDGCRIGHDEPAKTAIRSSSKFGGVMQGNGVTFADSEPRIADVLASASPLGRWPANLVLDEEAARLLDAQTGELGSGVAYEPTGKLMRRMYGPAKALGRTLGYGDSGGASRFFYTAKASRSEREAGLERFIPRNVNDGRDTSIDNPYQRGDTQRRNTHPTVKPVSLMRWLVRLITPPGGVVLDPFTGSGSTGVAAVLEGARFIGCELSAEFAELARARIAHAADEDDEQLTLFERAELRPPVKVQPMQGSFLWPDTEGLDHG